MTQLFDPNDRATILMVLADPDPQDPATQAIAEAVATRVNALTRVVSSVSVKHGAPDTIEIAKPQTALDEIAIALFRQAFQEPGTPPVVVHEYGKQ